MSSIRRVKEIIFLGTGTSFGVPMIACLIDPEKKCETCMSTFTPEETISLYACSTNNRNIVIDCGKTFYALKWWPYYELRQIDALILTHPHADAINGLDDLRAWTLHKTIQDHVSIYLTAYTLDAVKVSFPYLVDISQATGGDLPTFQWNIIDSKFQHGVYFSTNEPYTYIGFRFDNICYISDCNFIPEETRVKMYGSEIVILDSLDHKEHPSHFSIQQAIDTSKNLVPIPKRTYLTGFSHEAEHHSLTEEMKMLEEEEPRLWVRPAHDGLKVCIETDIVLPNGVNN
ncbi:7140_t:CDS:2 [Racocetra persica]|uniref:7140_t:CDS:1 n=1 Tax=Racocetra persica TaxID=160502 RepID=A0ACA9LUJ2_9GLOM|nr:7140_t:CDS:2 [Racocetra persica]